MKPIKELFARPDGFPELNYLEKTVFMGSCFSEHIHSKLRYFGFDSLSNPFGVVFHPLALAQQLEDVLNDNQSGEIFQFNDVWLHSLASSEIYGLSQEELINRYHEAQKRLQEAMSKSKILVLTFGSAHEYRLKSTNQVVANCHKQPGALFQKSLSSLEELGSNWFDLIEKLKNRFPDLRIVLTVSPVRYTRDGILENSRSKARLMELCALLSELENVFYFPSYELVNDVLRDFSYFEEDKSHPNSRAINEVWDLFKHWSVHAEIEKIISGVEEIRLREQHRFLFPESAETTKFTTVTNEKRERFHSLHPYITW